MGLKEVNGIYFEVFTVFVLQHSWASLSSSNSKYSKYFKKKRCLNEMKSRDENKR